MRAATGELTQEVRPILRGALHLGAAVGAVFGLVWLLLEADSPTGYLGGAVFATSLFMLYSTSATYHQARWRPSWHRTAKRLDHAMIFVLIAGTYTPFCLHVSLAWGVPMLSVVWTIAAAGALLKILWPDSPRWLGVTMYIGLGWVALVATAEILREFPIAAVGMLAAGGALYTIGAFIYGLRRPNPWPRVFGYHEVFHALVVAGSAVHYAAIALYVV
jgi:hemolysin III